MHCSIPDFPHPAFPGEESIDELISIKHTDEDSLCSIVSF